MRALLPILVVSFSAPATAQTIDASGAVQLGEVLSRYVGKTALNTGIIKVVADGDAYRVDLDFNRIGALFPPQEVVTYQIAPYGLRARPLPGGTWEIEGALVPDGWVEISQPPIKQRIQWTVTDGTMRAVYDPELRAVTTGTGSHKGLKIVTTDPMGTGETTYGASSITTTATKAPGGGLDVSLKQTMAGYSDQRSIRDPNTSTDFPVAIEAASVSLDSSGSGVRSAVLLDLLAFAVANDSPEKARAKQAELKTLLTEALPLWDHMRGGYSVDGISVTTPVGIFRVGRADVSFAMDGIRQDGMLNYAIRLGQMEVASFFLPSWAPPLVPTDVDINVGGMNFDLDEPARRLIAALDLGREPPVPGSVGQEIAAGFMADPPRLVVEKSMIRNRDTEITAEGELVISGGRPALDMTFEAKGYDAAEHAMQAAAQSDPRVAEVPPALAFARGIARTLSDGRLQWVLDIRGDGSAYVNGTMVRPAEAPAP